MRITEGVKKVDVGASSSRRVEGQDQPPAHERDVVGLGWRGTNRAGGQVASMTIWPGGHPADDLWRLVQPEPPAVPITITNMTAEATTTIATTGTKLDAVDTTDAVMAEIVANRALRGRYVWVPGLAWMRYNAGVTC
jgi:hypothetical protein